MKHKNEHLFIQADGDGSLTCMAKLILFALYFFRVTCCFTYGYIHPDEFFQGGQELFFRNDASSATVPTWEWESKSALRSILPPTFMTWIPTKIYAMIRCYITGGICGLDGFELLIVPRIFMCLATSIGIDATMWFLLKNIQNDHTSTVENKTSSNELLPILIVLSTSWTTLLFGTRPFTNTLETIYLSLLLAIVFGRFKLQTYNTTIPSHIKQFVIAFLVGCLCSIGVFTRLTFVGFAAPAVFILLYKCAKSYHSHRHLLFLKDQHQRPSKCYFSSWAHYAIGLIYAALCVIVGILVMSIIFLNADVTFYHQESLWDLIKSKSWRIILNSIPPLNFLRYNMNSNNLAQHGLHPRYLHVLINMPLMFGPLALLHWRYLISCLGYHLRSFFPKIKVNLNVKTQDPRTKRGKIYNQFDWTLNAVILSGLMMLSFAPHQEPRFLFPLVIPLTLLHGKSICSSKLLILLWIVFNLLLLFFFGLLHQSGVIPSMLFIGSQLSYANKSMRPSTIIYYKTYMPPTFLLHMDFRFPLDSSVVGATCFEDMNGTSEMDRQDHDSSICFELTSEKDENSSVQNRPRLVDLKSASITSFCLLIKPYLPRCENGDNDIVVSSIVYAVMPSIMGEKLSCHYSFHRVWGVKAHIGTEDLPQWINTNGLLDSASLFVHKLDLAVYNVCCKETGT